MGRWLIRYSQKLKVKALMRYLSTPAVEEEKLEEIIKDLDLNDKDEKSIRTFVISYVINSTSKCY